MISTYIQELLATNNRVIVPNYGAFLVRATSKSKDASTLEEKLKDIYFSPFLKFNDELLEKHIIKKESITKEEAAQKIKEFIDEVKKVLEQEKPYEIKGFGSFTADKQGKVQFLTVSKREAEPVKEKTTKAKAPEKKAEETKKTPATKKTKAVEPKKEEVKAVAKTEKVEEKPKTAETKPVRPAGGKEVVEPKKDSKLKEFKAEEKEVAPKKVEEPKATTTQAKSIYSHKKEKKPVNKGLVWAIAIGLPLAAIFIWGVLNFNTVKKVFIKEKAKTEKVAVKKKPVTTKKPAAKPKTDQAKQETKKAEVKKPTVAQKKYYIIAGSFKNEKYAISYMNKLKAEGYNAEKLSERNGMYAVSFNSFTDKRKAIAEYKFIAQEKGLQAWILYY